MGKALIIAEKPSVASDIAKALGGFTKHEDYYESDQYVLSSAIGHLLELACPEQFEVKKGKWTFNALPMIPPHFDLKPIEKTESRLRLLTRLIKRKDVDLLINACDAGREGELIFRNIVQHTGARQPIRRLWLQSMTPAAIREGFAALRTDEEMRPLADASLCRSEADWLVGINGTRAMTAFNSKLGGFQLTTVGRVQTPTLTILVEREEKIKKFVPRKYWEIVATFQAAGGTYTGRWFDETFARDKDKDRKDADTDIKAERVWDIARAEAIRAKCLGQPGVVTEESKPTTSLSPLLYDLTSLQREANSRFGFSAKNTLGLAQALYEKHKVLTYPRTDSRALPEDYIGTVKQTLGMLEGTAYRQFAGEILANDWVRPDNKRIFNNAKVSDHFAIIPTALPPKHLSEPEQKLYDLVTKRFLAVFYPAAEFLVTTRITRVAREPFKSEGKVMLKAGWMAVYGREVEDDATPNLAPVQPGETVHTREVEVKASETKPPPRFTEATLLSAMEGAGKLVEDEELRAAMKERGLGTPATRAAIIEGLIQEKYVHRLHKELQPTAKAFSLISLLRGLDIPELCKPELTGEWEHKLRLMARGQMQRAEFMREIADMTRHIVERAKGYESDTVPGDFGELKSPCPKCGSVIKETYRKFQCTNTGCDFFLWKSAAGRLFEAHEIDELIAKKQVGPLQGFRSKQGFPFAAVIKLTPEFKAEFDFGNDKDAEGAPAEVDFTGKEPVGLCPKCKSRVFENGMSYVCEKAVGAARSCDFRSGAIILQQPVDRAQMAKLLTEGRTDLLTKFISKKNGRPFKAFLVLGKDGKIGFEFEARAPKGRAGDDKTTKSKGPAPKLDFTGQEPLGTCPMCQARVFESETDYLCEKSQAASKPCKFKTGKTILQQPVDRAQVIKLLTTGRTDLLPGFVSGKTGRPFAAYLVLGEDKKVTFEFPPREGEGPGG
ncbi:MAG TPA: DNA topoisomerase III [Methylomirabilota bacterium]|nr:DNA topoisomerase III [Methylomirabilota bacterium]